MTGVDSASCGNLMCFVNFIKCRDQPMLLFSGPVTVISNQGHDIWSKYIFAVKIKNVCHIPIITKTSEYQIPQSAIPIIHPSVIKSASSVCLGKVIIAILIYLLA